MNTIMIVKKATRMSFIRIYAALAIFIEKTNIELKMRFSNGVINIHIHFIIFKFILHSSNMR